MARTDEMDTEGVKYKMCKDLRGYASIKINDSIDHLKFLINNLKINSK